MNFTTSCRTEPPILTDGCFFSQKQHAPLRSSHDIPTIHMNTIAQNHAAIFRTTHGCMISNNTFCPHHELRMFLAHDAALFSYQAFHSDIQHRGFIRNHMRLLPQKRMLANPNRRMTARQDYNFRRNLDIFFNDDFRRFVRKDFRVLCDKLRRSNLHAIGQNILHRERIIHVRRKRDGRGNLICPQRFHDRAQNFETTHRHKDDIKRLCRMLLDAPDGMAFDGFGIFIALRDEECCDRYTMTFEIEAGALRDGFRAVNENASTPPRF